MGNSIKRDGRSTEKSSHRKNTRRHTPSLRLLIDSMADLVIKIDPQGIIEYANPACATLGITQSEALGMCAFDFIHPDDLPKALDSFDRLRITGLSSSSELRLKNNKNEYTWFEVKGNLLFTAAKKPAGIVVVCRNASVRKRFEHTLRISEKRTAEKLRVQNTYLTSLHDTTLALLNRLDVNELLDTIICRAGDLLQTPHAFVYLVDTGKNALELKTGIGAYACDIGQQFSAGEGLAGKVWQSGQPMFVNNYPDWDGRSSCVGGKKIHSAICAPLFSAREVIGVVGLVTTETEQCFGEDELMLLSRFAELAALALDNARLHTAAQAELLRRKQAEERLRYINSHDSLTGLYNRAHFEEILRSLPTTEKPSPAVIIYDVDGLKLINDTMGHHAGDQLLVATAHILKKAFPPAAILARIGGDEFAAVLPSVDLPRLERLNKKIQGAVQRYNDRYPQLPLSLSTGYALKRSREDTIADLFKEADDNMYREKLHRGRSIRSMIVQGLLKALEARDFITEGHGERMEKLVVELASVLGLSERQIADLRLLAMFHDIGKVGISDSILFKPAPLTPSEFEEMRRHSEIGHRIALSATDLAPIADYILHHHEWWNGKGYPLGLREAEIPLACRILAIVDTYDAMTNDRPYRKALSHAQAISELQKYANVQFDPQLVRAFIGMIN